MLLGLFENPTDPFPDRTGTPARTVCRFLLQELRPLRLVVVAAVATTVLGALLEVWLIGYAGRIVDTLAAGSPDTFWAAHGRELIAVAAVILLVRPLLNLVGEALDDIAFRANARALARWRAHRHVSRQSVGWFRDDLAGRIATYVRDGGDAAATAAYSVIHTLIAVTAYIAGSVWVMSTVDVRLLVPLGAWIVAYSLLMRWAVPHYRRASERLQDAESALTGLLVDSYANADTLALLGHRPEDDERVFAEARHAHLGVQRVEVTINSTMTALSSALLVGLAGYGIVLWRTDAAPLGLIAAALALSFQITGMAEWLLDAVSSLFGAVGALRRALRTVAQPLAVQDRPGAPSLTVRGGAIRFAQVSHHYGRGTGGLDRLSLEVRAGERVGIVGRSGAGKSTLVGLLLRFHDPESGTITIDGADITEVTQESACGRTSPWSRRRPRCCTARSGRTSAPIRPRSTGRCAGPPRTASWRICATPTAGPAWTRTSASGACGSPAGSGSGSRSPARSTGTRRSWSWTRPRPRSTPSSRPPSTTRSVR